MRQVFIVAALAACSFADKFKAVKAAPSRYTMTRQEPDETKCNAVVDGKECKDNETYMYVKGWDVCHCVENKDIAWVECENSGKIWDHLLTGCYDRDDVAWKEDCEEEGGEMGFIEN